MAINIIVCMDKNGLIGNNNKLPWSLPSDLRYFKRVTEGNTVVMGRNTFESIGKRLPNRNNVIITSNGLLKDYTKYRDCIVLDSVEVILEMDATSSFEKDIFIIGGKTLYSQFLPYAENLFITEIDHEFEGDCYFPEYNKSEWDLIGQQKGIKDESNPYDYCFKIFTRRLTNER
jgi:dihydrofolate reductase